MKRLLIADDKPTNRELIRTVLENLGYEVIEAADGIEAVRVARELHPDLIILDLHMPGIDGFGVLAELRRDGGFVDTPIMALTASAMQGDRQRAMDAGFDSYVTKPVPLPVLRAEVERLLKSPTRDTALRELPHKPGL
jgi:CheY-like chemotaxis protein